MNTKIKITNYKKIGIINTAFIGDIVLSFFLSQKIKDVHPNSEITLITSPKVKELIPLVSSIDNAIYYDKRNTQKGLKGFINVIQKIKEEGIKLILAPHRSLRTSLITFFSKPELSVSYNISSFKFLYQKKVNYLFCEHEIERNLELLSIFEEFNNPIIQIPLISSFPEELVEQVQKKVPFELDSNQLISISPGSIWKTKQWNKDGFVSVAKAMDQRGFKVLLLGSYEDREICDYITSQTNAINLAGITNLAESLYILKKSKLLITNDSSPTHLATLVDCPTITIYGPTIPEFGFYPRATKHRIIQFEGLKCRPCSIHGYEKCPLKHHRCMKEITSEIVIDAALEMLYEN